MTLLKIMFAVGVAIAILLALAFIGIYLISSIRDAGSPPPRD